MQPKEYVDEGMQGFENQGRVGNDLAKDGARPSSTVALFIRKDVATVNGFSRKSPRVFLTFT